MMVSYSAQGSIILDNGVKKTKRSGFGESGCTSLQNAKRHVLKGLANKLRAYHEGVEGWVEWRDLSSSEQQAWLDRVACTLRWDELNGGRTANMHTVHADVLLAALSEAAPKARNLSTRKNSKTA